MQRQPCRPPPAAPAAPPDHYDEANWRLLCCDLHDGAAQYLAAALLRLQTVAARHEVSAEAGSQLRVAENFVAVALRDVRDIIAGRPPACSLESGFVAGLRHLVEELASAGGIEIEFVERLQQQRFPPCLERAAFRILQEGLTNALRHSGSDRVRAEIAAGPGVLRLEVRDWGCGFDADAVTAEHRGLRGIRDRCALLGGKATIQTRPGWGTLVAVELPLSGG